MKKTLPMLLAAIAAALLSTSCISHKSAPSYTYLLCPENINTQKSDCYLTLANLTLAEYLDRGDMVMRQGKRQVRVISNRCWAQNFHRMLAESLSDNLIARSTPNAPAYKISIQLRRFEIDEKNDFNVNAICAFKDSSERQFSQLVTFTLPWNGTDFNELIDLHDKALATLADKIVAIALENK